MLTKATSIVLAVLLLTITIYAIDPPDKETVIEEVSRFTGLSRDALSMVFDESPKLLDDIDDTVFAIQIVDKFCEARDTEALVDLYDYALGKALDKMKDQLLPSALNGLLTAFSFYQASLEAIRDYYFIPRFEERIYREYKKARSEDLQRGDTSYESKQTAFSRATTQRNSGYYVVRDQMFARMIKAKGYNPELIGEKLERDLHRKIDAFWLDRLELQLQQEVIRNQREQIVSAIWKKSAGRLKAIQAGAGQASGPGGFFFTGKDMPDGWRMSVSERTRPEEINPHLRQDGAWQQIFTFKPAGFQEKNGRFYAADGKTILTFMHNRVRVIIEPEIRILRHKDMYNRDRETRFSFKARVEEDIRNRRSSHNSNARFVRGLPGQFGIETGYLALDDKLPGRAHEYVAVFIKNGWHVTIELSAYSMRELERLVQKARASGRIDNYVMKTPFSEQVMLSMVRTVAGKIGLPKRSL